MRLMRWFRRNWARIARRRRLRVIDGDRLPSRLRGEISCSRAMATKTGAWDALPLRMRTIDRTIGHPGSRTSLGPQGR